jgi:hypothetical protein
MTETALQGVTALHPGRNGVTPDGGRAGAEKQRMQRCCRGVQQRCTLRPTGSRTCRARKRQGFGRCGFW